MAYDTTGNLDGALAGSRTLRAPHIPVVELTDRKALEQWRPAEPEILEQAKALKDETLLDFGMTHSAIASWIYSKCSHHIPTTAIETAAVMAAGDGSCLLLYNPEFLVSIGREGTRFVLFHEARHLIQRHLFSEPELNADPLFTLACEVTINHVAMTRLRTGLPRSLRTDPDTGAQTREPTGVDPQRIHALYDADLRGQGLEPLAFSDFVATDHTVHTELHRMKDKLVPPPLCVHQLLGADGGLDAEAVASIGNQVLRDVLLGARRGNRVAREELLDLLNRTDGASDRLNKLWGDLGAHSLRGETQRTRRVDWWQRWLVDVLASKLREGERLIYPKKRGALLAALGHDPMLARRGRERTKVVMIAFDTSGSMSQQVVEWLTTLVGQTDGVEAHWLSFDGVVMPFKPGERVHGGGGTNFQNVVDYVEGRYAINGERFDEPVDAVVMVTDGYAAKVAPAEPDKWIWLITDGGDDWPDSHRPQMSCHRVTTGER